jgi:hypothetical protein
MTPIEYFEQHVLPDYREYEEAEKELSAASIAGADVAAAKSKAIRKATSAKTTWHMADWMWKHQTDPAQLFHCNSLADFRKEVEQRYCVFLRSTRAVADFNLIGAIADAFKYCELNSDTREIKSAAAAGMTTGWDELQWDEGKWRLHASHDHTAEGRFETRIRARGLSDCRGCRDVPHPRANHPRI